jgi:hypothetical protein
MSCDYSVFGKALFGLKTAPKRSLDESMTLYLGQRSRFQAGAALATA